MFTLPTPILEGIKHMRIQQVYTECISYYNETKEFNKLHRLIKKRFWFGVANKGVLNEISPKNLLKL